MNINYFHPPNNPIGQALSLFPFYTEATEEPRGD